MFFQAPNQTVQYRDPYFENVYLLLNGRGTLSGNNLQNCDASQSNLSMTRVGAATVTTTGYRFGGKGLFSGTTTGDTLTYAIDTAAGSIPAFGTGDFTIELWFNKTLSNSTDISMRVLEMATPTLSCAVFLSSSVVTPGYPGLTGVGRCAFFCGPTANLGPGITAPISTNVWHHAAFSRVAGITRVFFDGGLVSPGGIADTTNYGLGRVRLFNGISTTNRNLAGYIDDVRITIGVGRYTATFPVPTRAHPTS